MTDSATNARLTGRRPVLNYTESSWALLAATRFVLAAIVFVSHLSWFAKLPPVFASMPLLGGKAAVLAFLLISGVSIGHSYRERPDGYFRRRFLRIYPLYFAAVCFPIILTYALGSPFEIPGQTLFAAHWKTNFANFFFLQEFFAITIVYNGPLWTLALEVFYYVWAPALNRMRFLALTSLVLASLLFFAFSHKNWLLGYPAVKWAWPWLLGFVIATRGASKATLLLAVIGIAATAIDKTDTGEALSWLTFAVAAGIVFLAGRVRLPARVCAGLNFLGEQSYPLYLFHFPLCLALFRYAGMRSAWWFMAGTLISVVILDYVLDYWLKDRFWKPALNHLSQQRGLLLWTKPAVRTS